MFLADFPGGGWIALWTSSFIFFVAYVCLGLLCARNRHWLLLIFGFLLPILWMIGAIMGGKRRRHERREERREERRAL
jgi:hypothetical protein